MKKLVAILLLAGTFAGALAQAYTQDEEMDLSKECKVLAQSILKKRSQERLVKAQIKISDDKEEKKSLAAKLEKVRLGIKTSKAQFQIACTSEK